MQKQAVARRSREHWPDMVAGGTGDRCALAAAGAFDAACQTFRHAQEQARRSVAVPTVGGRAACGPQRCGPGVFDDRPGVYVEAIH